jgi:Domain of unknown function (DUF4184)
MPFTPFHFGLGIFAKGAASNHCSLSVFVASQVAIDLETLYYMANYEYPLHRTLHTFVGGTAAGLLVALTFFAAGRILFRLAPQFQERFSKRRELKSEFTLLGCLVGGILGGFSHSILDGIMHSDVRPLLPWSLSRPLLGMIDLPTLHSGLVILGIIGCLILIIRAYWASTTA